MLWRFVRSLDVVKTTRWADAADSPMSYYRILWATTLLSSAVLVVIATIIAVARIGYEEQSLVAFVILLVTIIQVEDVISMLQFTNKIIFYSHGETCTWLGSTFQVTPKKISNLEKDIKKSSDKETSDEAFFLNS